MTDEPLVWRYGSMTERLAEFNSFQGRSGPSWIGWESGR
jgi:hypothetical protein